ncbi:MAG: hypothetical protein KAH98_02830 [Dehalococcoidia bacterium]|nr:hypothetical protein [Dehalococcoidia bacterium]
MAEITPSTIKRDFNVIVSETFDLIVIRGGIIAAGIARDASLRGFRTLLLEKDGFALDTTACSSRFIHGGLCYLRRLEFSLVCQRPDRFGGCETLSAVRVSGDRQV